MTQPATAGSAPIFPATEDAKIRVHLGHELKLLIAAQSYFGDSDLGRVDSHEPGLNS